MSALVLVTSRSGVIDWGHAQLGVSPQALMRRRGGLVFDVALESDLVVIDADILRSVSMPPAGATSAHPSYDTGPDLAIYVINSTAWGG